MHNSVISNFSFILVAYFYQFSEQCFLVFLMLDVPLIISYKYTHCSSGHMILREQQRFLEGNLLQLVFLPFMIRTLSLWSNSVCTWCVLAAPQVQLHVAVGSAGECILHACRCRQIIFLESCSIGGTGSFSSYNCPA